MKSLRTFAKRHYFRKTVIYLLIYCLILNTSVPVVLAIEPPATNALPSGGSVVPGYGGVGQFDYSITNELHVRDVAERTVINWDSFDIGSGALTKFYQLGDNPAVLNRITGGDMSRIFGTLEANGAVYIVNSAGVYFGAGASVNVNQLVASSLDITNDNFWDGIYEFAAGEGTVGGITNDGTITTAEGVALLGKYVQNNGSLVTGEGGFVVMAAGDRVLLGESGSNIVVEMDSVTTPAEGEGTVTNSGQITAPAGTVVLAAGDIFSSALALDERAVKVEGGIGKIQQTGTIRANGTSGSVNGGTVTLTAAEEVVLSSGSQTTANAAVGGDSGLVTVHSKGRTDIQTGAQIQATGGYVPVDHYEDYVDTSVEIVGEQVNLAGSIDASATGTKRGKVTIDAFNLTVADGARPATVPDNTIYEKWIEAQSQAATDVELVAHSKTMGNITVEDIGDGEITGGSGDIILRTRYNTGGIAFLGDPATIHTTNGGNIYMLAGEGGITVGDIVTDVPSSDKVTEPGKIRLYTNNYGDITTGKLTVNGGSYDEVSVIACGDLTINGEVETSTNQVPAEDKTVGQAKTCLVSVHGDINIDGSVTVDAHGKYNTTADIHICAGEDVTINLGGGQIRATTKTSESGSANATIAIHAGKNIEGPGVIAINGGGSNAVYAEAKGGGGSDSALLFTDGQSNVDLDQTNGGAHAKIDIDNDRTEECPDCPKPPFIEPPIDPMVEPYSTTTHMNHYVSGNVLEGEYGLSVDSYTQPSHGTITMAADGNFTYTPNDGYADNETPDTFTYIATDGELYSEPITVTITVTNTLPAAVGDEASTHMGTTITGNVLGNDIDVDGDSLTVVLDGVAPQHGTLVLNPDGSYTYTPYDGYADNITPDSFSYLITDGQRDSEGNLIQIAGTATISVNNTLPAAVGDEASTHMGTTITGNVLGNDIDVDGDSLTVVLDGVAPQHGTLVLNPDGTFTYTPDAGYKGVDTFAYTVTDGQLDNGTPVMVTGAATITMANIIPIANPDTISTNQNIPVVINVVNNDIDLDGDLLTVLLDGVAPQHGTLTLNLDGTFTYTPDAGYVGEDTFAYIVTDGQLVDGTPITVTATATIIVNASLFIPAAPLPEEIEFGISGCPTLIEWTANEVGIEKQIVQVWMANVLASPRDIQPCDACASLKTAATVLQDKGGTYKAAMVEVLKKYASSEAPLSEEQMALINTAIRNNTEDDNALARMEQYLDTIVAYVGILNGELDLTLNDSVTVATDKYVAPLAEDGNAGLAAFVAARLTALGQ